MEPGSQIVGVVARLEPEKGHPTLLEAWPLSSARCPDAYLLIVGEGSRREALEAQARELRIAHRVVFTGRRDDVPAVTAALDVAVLPSYREAQGLSILEAMALSRPVVASNVGGIPEMIEDGVTGLLVPPHDADALAAAIVRLLTRPPVRRHARACAATTWSTTGSASSSWSTRSRTIYDEGARADPPDRGGRHRLTAAGLGPSDPCQGPRPRVASDACPLRSRSAYLAAPFPTMGPDR